MIIDPVISFIGGENISIHERAAVSCINAPIVDHTIDTAIENETASVSNIKNSCSSRIIEDKKSSSASAMNMKETDEEEIREEVDSLRDHLTLQNQQSTDDIIGEKPIDVVLNDDGKSMQ